MIISRRKTVGGQKRQFNSRYKHLFQQKLFHQGGYRTRQQKNEEVKRRQRLKDLETRIAEKESQIQQLEQEITLPEIYENYILMGEKCKELEEKRQNLSLIMEEWVQLSE